MDGSAHQSLRDIGVRNHCDDLLVHNIEELGIEQALTEGLDVLQSHYVMEAI